MTKKIIKVSTLPTHIQSIYACKYIRDFNGKIQQSNDKKHWI